MHVNSCTYMESATARLDHDCGCRSCVFSASVTTCTFFCKYNHESERWHNRLSKGYHCFWLRTWSFLWKRWWSLLNCLSLQPIVSIYSGEVWMLALSTEQLWYKFDNDKLGLQVCLPTASSFQSPQELLQQYNGGPSKSVSERTLWNELHGLGIFSHVAWMHPKLTTVKKKTPCIGKTSLLDRWTVKVYNMVWQMIAAPGFCRSVGKYLTQKVPKQLCKKEVECFGAVFQVLAFSHLLGVQLHKVFGLCDS